MQPITGAGALSPWQPGIFSLVLYMVVVLALTTPAGRREAAALRKRYHPHRAGAAALPGSFFHGGHLFFDFRSGGGLYFFLGDRGQILGVDRVAADRFFHSGSDRRSGLCLGEGRA